MSRGGVIYGAKEDPDVLLKIGDWNFGPMLPKEVSIQPDQFGIPLLLVGLSPADN